MNALRMAHNLFNKHNFKLVEHGLHKCSCGVWAVKEPDKSIMINAEDALGSEDLNQILKLKPKNKEELINYLKDSCWMDSEINRIGIREVEACKGNKLPTISEMF